MKKMTCKDLGGACDTVFEAETFEEIKEMSMSHGMAMFKKQDKDHLEAMKKMKALMNAPKEMEAWMESKRKAFEALPASE